MDINKIPLMSAITSKLSWLSQKQEVISQNVANANTPGYRSRSIEEPNFSDILNNQTQNPVKATLNQTMRQTSGKHMSFGSNNPASSAKASVVVDKHASDSNISGNTVVLEDQMMEMAKTQLEYSTTINLYKRHMGLIKAALGGGRR